MNFLDLTLPTPEENLACDEALLDAAEAGESGEALRLWEPTGAFVVLGYANKVAIEVNLPFCESNNIPILRRCTGGGAVLQARGILNYSLILRAGSAPCNSIPATNKFVLTRHQSALSTLLGQPVELRGQTDLAIADRKFSGNSQRRKKKFLLFHGSFLLSADIGLIEKTLSMPSKQPCYRNNRSHSDFLMNLEVPPDALKQALRDCWQASYALREIPCKQISELLAMKYSQREWNFKF